MNQRDNAFELYKPVRNYLRQFCVEESLYVIWAYSLHLHLGNKIPSDIEVSTDFLHEEHFPNKNIFLWELELLTREILVNAQKGSKCKDSFKSWRLFARCINKFKTLENNITARFVDDSNVLLEVNRTAYRQFPWQSILSKNYLIRYYKIFSHPNIDNIVKNELDLTVYQLYLVGFTFFAAFLNSVAITKLIDINYKELNLNTINKFLQRFSKSLIEVNALINKGRAIDDKFAYSNTSLRAFPLITMDYDNQYRIVCPLPTLLFWRFTGGLYYELINKDDFGKL